MRQYTPDIIYVQKDAKGYPLTKRILQKLPDVPIEHVPGPIHADQSISQGKRVLQIVLQKGSFLSECPGSPNMVCCGYHVLNNAFNCPFDCTYCFLQSYVNNRIMTVYANIDEMLSEIDTFLKEHPEYTTAHPLRLGTGEFTDSLALDHLTGLSDTLIGFFSKKQNVIFELKTKSDVLPELPVINGTPHTLVLAWSLNTPAMIQANELKTATLEERLAAASHAARTGASIAFHFDPLIHYPGWQKDYRDVVKKMFTAVPADRVIWISLGTFRFNAPLKPIIRERFPKNPITAGEFIPGQDGKQRYFKDIRVDMYRHMVSQIKECAPSAFVYLCMETPYIWEKVFGYRIEDDAGLQRLFDRRIESLRRR